MSDDDKFPVSDAVMLLLLTLAGAAAVYATVHFVVKFW